MVAEAMARRMAASLAILLQAATLLRAGSPVAAAFIAARLAAPMPPAYGMLDASVAFSDILERAVPSR